VTVTVGATKKAYPIYKGLISFHSSYFRRAFHGSFSEAEKGVVELSEDAVDVFDVFYAWINTGRMWDLATGDGPQVPLSFNLLYKLWIFGDVRGSPAFKNAAVDAFMHKVSDEWLVPCQADVQYIYANTLDSADLRKCVVYTKVQTHSLKKTVVNVQGYPSEFLADWMVALSVQNTANLNISHTLKSRTQFAKTDRCQFHDHTPPEEHSR